MGSFENCRLVGVSVGFSFGLFVDAVGIWISSSSVGLYGDCALLEHSEIVKWDRGMELTSQVDIFYVDRRHQLAYHPWVYITLGLPRYFCIPNKRQRFD